MDNSGDKKLTKEELKYCINQLYATIFGGDWYCDGV
jgi:hypothetical protein